MNNHAAKIRLRPGPYRFDQAPRRTRSGQWRVCGRTYRTKRLAARRAGVSADGDSLTLRIHYGPAFTVPLGLGVTDPSSLLDAIEAATYSYDRLRLSFASCVRCTGGWFSVLPDGEFADSKGRRHICDVCKGTGYSQEVVGLETAGRGTAMSIEIVAGTANALQELGLFVCAHFGTGDYADAGRATRAEREAVRNSNLSH